MFFLIILRAPVYSIFFPYTTLFRSSFPLDYWRAWLGRIFLTGDSMATLTPIGFYATARRRNQNQITSSNFKEPAGGLMNIDRKSTRLNSSHTVISYAVFCLKKKRNI